MVYVERLSPSARYLFPEPKLLSTQFRRVAWKAVFGIREIDGVQDLVKAGNHFAEPLEVE
jgi:hypothetical protein